MSTIVSPIQDPSELPILISLWKNLKPRRFQLEQYANQYVYKDWVHCQDFCADNMQAKEKLD